MVEKILDFKIRSYIGKSFIACFFKMRKKIKTNLSFSLITLVIAFSGSNLFHAKANEASSQTESPKLEEQAAGIKGEYEEFLRKFKEKPPHGMILIPGGVFMMGSEHGDTDEKPVHEVALGPFFIDQFEVTQKKFEKVMGFNPSIFISGTFTGGYLMPGESGEEPAKFKGHNRPVERVTWHEAKEYCEKLNKRLPTEAEWEYAARAGSTTKFYWGDKSDVSFSWTAKNARSRSHLVGEKNPNAFNLYDISGNVWEWVADWYEEKSYSKKPEANPKGPVTGVNKVMRGGSWYAHPNYSRSTYRAQNDPTVKYTDIGFRCVLAPLW
ncbi:MAG: hypothetical protein CMH77_07985 [Nitrospinae bacterium]|nr:hypothetical protein [Nitrospinota bacterium]